MIGRDMSCPRRGSRYRWREIIWCWWIVPQRMMVKEREKTNVKSTCSSWQRIDPTFSILHFLNQRHPNDRETQCTIPDVIIASMFDRLISFVVLLYHSFFRTACDRILFFPSFRSCQLELVSSYLHKLRRIPDEPLSISRIFTDKRWRWRDDDDDDNAPSPR